MLARPWTGLSPRRRGLLLRDAVDGAGPGYDRLRVLDTALEPPHTSAGVAELRDRLTTTAA